MKIIRRFFTFPVLLLILGILAFGIQAGWLGFYLDDWVVLYHIFRGGWERLAAYSFGVNRPLGAWPWWLGFSLLGYSPVRWQWWSLAWRLITAVFLWMGWKEIFPEKKADINLACALFLVYPIFLQQTAAVTFSDHWICFALYAMSVFLMARAITARGREGRVLLTALALLTSGIELFTLEYFVGLELIRPLLLWFGFRDIPRKGRGKKVLAYELPYTALLGVFLAWRFIWMPTPGFDRNQPVLLSGLIHTPLATGSAFMVKAIQDILQATIGAWYPTYNPAAVTLTPITDLLSWGVAAVAFGVAFLFFSGRFTLEEESAIGEIKPGTWIGIGFILMIAGLLPAWVTGQQLFSNGNYADRFGLAAMPGASLLVVGLTGWLVRRRHQIFLVCLLIALAAGYQFRLANAYRRNWEQESRLAWQLSWRVPGLAAGTAVYGDGTLAAGSWADIAWLNFLYGSPAGSSGLNATEDNWYYDLNKIKPGEVPPRGQALSESRFERLSFQGNTSDSLVIQFKTVDHQCLWVVSEVDQANPYLNPRVKEALPLSDLSRIVLSGRVNPLVRTIFLPEPVHEWCYYFEKAQLAVQQARWDDVKVLWQGVQAGGLKTGVAIEYLPFIEGFARGGDFATALAISQRAESIDLHMQDPLCRTWKAIFEADNDASSGVAGQREAVVGQLGCGYLIK